MATPDAAQPGFRRGRNAVPAAAASPVHHRRPAAHPPDAPTRTALLSPWGDPDKWDVITIGGVIFTGKCTLSGEGVKKKNDHRSPRGRNGGRTVATGFDLAEITVTLSAFPSEDHPDDEDEQVRQLDAIIARVATRAPSRQDVSAIPIAHPALSALGLASFTLTSIDLPEFVAGGTLNVAFKFKEWRAPTVRPARTTAAASEQPAEPATIRPNGTTMTPIAAPGAAPRAAPVVPRPSASGAAAPRPPPPPPEPPDEPTPHGQGGNNEN